MNYLEITGTIVGLVYLWLEYKANIYLWIAGIVMPAIYIFVYYRAGLYADFGINIYYFLAAIYGYLGWKYGYNKKEKGRIKMPHKAQLPISHLSSKLYVPILGIFLALWLVIAYILIHFTNSTVPYWDSFITALSVIGMWVLAKKYIEQWIIWIVVDAVAFGLYIYKDLYFTSGLYGIYTIIAFLGYRKWKGLMQHQKM